jgi:prevent-host-death family protein
MKKIPAGKFKAQCLSLMDEVQATREPLLITKHGRPVAKLVPAGAAKHSDDVFGCLRGVMKIIGDIESPLVSPEDWKATR